MVTPGAQYEALAELTPIVQLLILEHRKQRKLWFPNDLLPTTASDKKLGHELKELRVNARAISPAIKVALALNLLTEEGLPHFHRVLTAAIGLDSAWGEWNFLWTAEEDRHGCILRDYVRDAGLYDLQAVEAMQYEYLVAGFLPKWEGDFYRTLAYTIIQEKATQTSHRGIGKLVQGIEPVLHNIMAHLAGDENRHFRFYHEAFKALLQIDPTNALKAAAAIFPALTMPGYAIMNFKNMAEVQAFLNIYGPWEYKNIIETVIASLEIAKLTTLPIDALQAQEQIMLLPKRLEAVAKRFDTQIKKKSFTFDFLPEKVILG